jgi:hypothetical protein
VILDLSYLGDLSWYADRIDTRRCLNRVEKVLVSYVVEVKLCLVSSDTIKCHGENKRTLSRISPDSKPGLVISSYGSVLLYR